MVNSLILIGASTGGPGHINRILEKLPKDFSSSLIIAQHMSSTFIPSFIKQLTTLTSYPIFEVNQSLKIQSSTIYVCNAECRLSEREREIYIDSYNNSESLYTPDIDTLFISAASLPWQLRRMGVIMTGIGEDGAKGAEALYQSGAKCLFESEESSIVYGMPRSAAERVPDAEVLGLDGIVEKIIQFGVGHVEMV